MKKWLIMLVAVAVCFASVTKQAWPMDGQNEKGQSNTFTDATLIAVSGDIRSVLGPQGKSIAVSASGDAIAVIYGDATTDPQNIMEIYVAYSLNGGATWTTYGPHSPELRRIYPGVDGSADFDVNPGELYFEWQESAQGYVDGDLRCMIEENMPSAPSFSSPVSMPAASGDLCPWLGTVAVNTEDPFWVITDGWSYLNNGNQAVYFWVSEDGGYTWSDTIRVLDPIDATGCTGHARFGSGDYVHYIYQDLKTIGSFDKPYPYYIESTDGGYTWSTPTAMPDVPLLNAENCQFWWHELDLEVVNDEIWRVENDINQVFPVDSAGFWIFHGTGGPGSWSWDIINFNDYNQEWYEGDIYKYFEPGQYGSVCHDPVSGMIAITCQAFYITVNTVTHDTTHYGSHVGAIYTLDNGANWIVSAPLSTPWTGGDQANWNGTETAHRLVNDGGDVWAYTVWIEDATFNTYFEVGQLVPYPGVAEMENGIVSYNFSVRPNVTTDRCEAVFKMPVGGTVGVKLYDVGGRLIENVYTGNLAQGNQTINVNTADLATGTYFVVLETEAGSDAQKIIKVH